MGDGQVSKFAKVLAERLEKPKKNAHTAKSFRRSAATQLVEAGVSIVGLCEAGNWKSLDAAREHTEHSTVATKSRMSMLDGRKRSVEDADCTDGEVSLFKKMCMKQRLHKKVASPKAQTATVLLLTLMLQQSLAQQVY